MYFTLIFKIFIKDINTVSNIIHQMRDLYDLNVNTYAQFSDSNIFNNQFSRGHCQINQKQLHKEHINHV